MADRIEDYEQDDERSFGGLEPDLNQPDQAAIREDIRETRERMSGTLDDLGERLNPNHLKAQVKENIREATIGRAEHMARNAVSRVDETRHSIMDTVRDNPIPATMVGIGLGWLFWNGRKQDSYERHPRYARHAYGGERYVDRGDRYVYTAGGRYGGYDYEYDYEEPSVAERTSRRVSEFGENARDRAEELTDRAQDAVSDAVDRTQEVIGDTAERARSAARNLAAETRYRTHRLEDRFQDTLYETPLALGAAAVALGLVAGLSAPATRRESELMGGARDQLVRKARDVASETTEKVQRVAERVIDEAQDTAQEAAREQGLTSPQGGTGGTGGGAI
ncbi:MAG: DUF3618 domain-containing protein [Gemmatimonadota bacterium]|nr:DUF3618 domain-containing protein [Gemmatimonadota bacterium]